MMPIAKEWTPSSLDRAVSDKQEWYNAILDDPKVKYDVHGAAFHDAVPDTGSHIFYDTISDAVDLLVHGRICIKQQFYDAVSYDEDNPVNYIAPCYFKD